ncbi:MAG: ATP-binding cassette domain-containing protein [Chitinophagaceae bacterium]
MVSIHLFKNISFHINEGDKIALIARNGVGKSTLITHFGWRRNPGSRQIICT